MAGCLFCLGETVEEVGEAGGEAVARDALGVLQDFVVAFLWED